MARNTSGRRLVGLLAILVSGMRSSERPVEPRWGRLGPRRHMLALELGSRRYERRELPSPPPRQVRKAHSQAMANDGYIYHSTGDQLRRALDG